MRALRLFVPALATVVVATAASDTVAQGYRLPPKPIVDCLDAEPTPRLSLSPTRDYAVLTTTESMPSLEIQSRPILRLAGMRIDRDTRGPQLGQRTYAMSLLRIADGSTRKVDLPKSIHIGDLTWSADGKRIAFSNTNTTTNVIEVWVLEVGKGFARRIGNVRLGSALSAGRRSSGAIRWMPDQKTLLCRLTPSDAGPPAKPAAPRSPNIQESKGVKAPVRTYQDLLTSEHDAQLFEYYTTSQLALVGLDGSIRKVGKPGIATAVPSPDGKFLLVTRIKRPFSYLLTARSFPREIYVTDLTGKVVTTIADLPLAERVPLGGVPVGPRSVQWMAVRPASLTWAEAVDGGDTRKNMAIRDRILVWDHPFSADSRVEWTRTRDRFSGFSYSQSGKVAILSENSRHDRRYRMSRLDATNLSEPPKVVFEGSTQDGYGNPGTPMTRVTADGRSVLAGSDAKLLFAGSGASPQGDHPFLDSYDVASGKRTRLFHCAGERYESVVAPLDDAGSRLLVQRESKYEPPNYFIVDRASGDEHALTKFRDASAEVIRKIQVQRLNYKRADGIDLTATMYLPPGYRDGERLPLLVWAYPREYGSRQTAAQVRGSFHRYTRLSGTSPLLMTLAGYAVMNNAAIPIVGPHRTANDTFVRQLVAGAKAAIDKAVAIGVADRDRTAIAGHSYGAFMTANLLAHSDLFRAGIARSGAFNRTLTPFGFQNERRTYWEAPDVYFAMSPFMHAPKIDEPILLIHGEADNNSGTFPVQSRRLFHAIKGSGGKARLVMLPHESHGYRARESVMHCLAESVAWLDTHVKNAGPRSSIINASDKRKDKK